MPWSYRSVLLAIVFVTVASGCRRATPTRTENIATVRAVAASLSEESDGIHYSVSLIPNRQADLAFKSSGIVDQIRNVRGADGHPREITMGDAVGAGEVLARVRTSDYRQKVDQAAADLRQATAQKENAQASLTLAESNFTRASHLYQEQSLTRQDYDRAQQQRDSAAAAVHQAEAGIANATAEMAQARTALNDTAITAPFAGVVVARHVELGNLASGGGTAFTIADLSVLKANFSIPDTALKDVPLGRKFGLRVMPDFREIPAQITAVSPSADPQSRVFTVELTIANPRGDLKPGMIGSVELTSHAPVQPHITVPISSLVQSNSDHGFAVFVLDGGSAPRVHLRPVLIGATKGSTVQILSGLTAGEHVVAAGAQTLHDNDAVRVLE